MLHHLDIHTADLTGPKALFDAIAGAIGYQPVPDHDAEFAGYTAAGGRRPNVGFIRDLDHRPGSMRVAFGVGDIAGVDRAAKLAAAAGAGAIEGPGFHPEYGDDYYAVFFEDDQGNKYEVCRDEAVSV